MIRTILPIYLINFLLAVSSTMGMTFLPLLATEKLGISLLVIGIIEGGTEFVSSILRLVTGNIFDNIKNRRWLFLFPTITAFLGKIMLVSPNSITIFLSKIMERISNGAFAAPRDAFIGQHSSKQGTAMGMLSVTKTAGCIIGPVIISAYTLLGYKLSDNINIIIYFACFLCFLTVLITLIINTDSPVKINSDDSLNFEKIKLSVKKLSPFYILSFVFFLGRFNDGLIILYLKYAGFPEWFYLATISIFNTIMMLISPILGYGIDQKKGKYIFVITTFSLLIFNVLFYYIHNMTWLFAILGLMMWGVQRAGAQITFTSTIFKNIDRSYYGSAVGIYSCISGIGTFIASIICGYLAQLSFIYIFLFSGVFSTIALMLSLLMIKKNWVVFN